MLGCGQGCSLYSARADARVACRHRGVRPRAVLLYDGVAVYPTVARRVGRPESQLLKQVLQTLQSRAQAILTNHTARQAAQMTFLRFIGLGIGVVAQIYATRQLGPEKLGVSGMAVAAVAQGSILVIFGTNTLLVREFKQAATPEQKEILIQLAYTLRALLTIALLVILLLALPWILQRQEFLLPAACIIPLIFFESNNAAWLLQAQEKLPSAYLALLAIPIVSAVLIFLFVSDKSPAGSELLAAVAGTALAFIATWRLACGSHSPRLRLNFLELKHLMARSKWLFLSAVLAYCYTKLDQPLVGILISTEQLGIYRSSWQIISGLGLFLLVVPLLLYPKLVSWLADSPSTLWRKQWSIFSLLAPGCVVVSAVAFAMAPAVYPLIYGPQFAAGALPSALLLSGELVGMLAGIYTWGLWAAKKDALILSLLAAIAASSIVANLLIIPRWGILGAATVNLLSQILLLAGAITLARMHAQNQS